MTRGTLIVFEGLDRAGKSTQCQRLVERLDKSGVKVKHLRFPGTLYLRIQSACFARKEKYVWGSRDGLGRVVRVWELCSEN